MYLDAALAYLHYLAIFVLGWTLLRQWSLLRGGPPALDLAALARTWRIFFVAAILAFATGISRVFLGAKPMLFYAHNPLFHLKAGLVVLLIVLAIPPALASLGWRRAQRAAADFRVAPNAWRGVRRWLLIELHLLALIPALAVLMARGIGLHD